MAFHAKYCTGGTLHIGDSKASRLASVLAAVSDNVPQGGVVWVFKVKQ
jgi:hypothetical protein